MFRRLNIALVAAAALTAATWAVPAAANGQQPTGAAVSGKTADVAVPKKVRRAAVRKRIAWAPRVRQPVSRVVQPTWFSPPYERIAARWPILMLGIGF